MVNLLSIVPIVLGVHANIARVHEGQVRRCVVLDFGFELDVLVLEQLQIRESLLA
jgi:hypothetical protein